MSSYDNDRHSKGQGGFNKPRSSDDSDGSGDSGGGFNREGGSRPPYAGGPSGGFRSGGGGFRSGGDREGGSRPPYAGGSSGGGFRSGGGGFNREGGSREGGGFDRPRRSFGDREGGSRPPYAGGPSGGFRSGGGGFNREGGGSREGGGFDRPRRSFSGGGYNNRGGRDGGYEGGYYGRPRNRSFGSFKPRKEDGLGDDRVPSKGDSIYIKLHYVYKGWEELLPNYEEVITSVAQYCLKRMQVNKLYASVYLKILLVGDRFMQRISEEYKKTPARLTNVFSFAYVPLHPDKFTPEQLSAAKKYDGFVHIGDVAVSADAVANETASEDTAVAEHVCLLVIHGILSIMGYDDPAQCPEEKFSDLKEEVLAEFIKEVGIPQGNTEGVSGSASIDTDEGGTCGLDLDEQSDVVLEEVDIVVDEIIDEDETSDE